LAEQILAARPALEGERKQVTVLFADLKDSTELIRGLEPEAAKQLLDPAIHVMMDAVHRFEGTVNQVLGDGIMALFGAHIAHEDHALRACYAALAMQAAMRVYTEEVRRTRGLELRMRVGLNVGEVVVRAIGNDLHMDYSAVGETTVLAARMEQTATPGTIRLPAATLRLVEGLVQVTALGPVPVKGLAAPVEVCELTGASPLRRRLQAAAAARGLTPLVGRQPELETLRQTLAQAHAGRGQVMALVGEAGVGKSRLVYELLHSHPTQGWRVLESASVSYGKATPYFPVIDLLKRYCHVEDGDDVRAVRAKVTGQVLTLDETLQGALPPLLALLDALPDGNPFVTLDPPQRRQRTLDGLKRVLLRECQVQPLCLIFEDLHWLDAETQALLDSVVESLPTAQLLLLVNYRPEYQHTWGSKTYYTQLRLDPLPPSSAEEFLVALWGNDPSLRPLTQVLIMRTGGNPFFLEESVRTLVETKVLVGVSEAYRLVRAVPTIRVPATVQAVLTARIDRLPPEDKRLLQTAAVIGTAVPFALLRAIADVPEEILHRGLARSAYREAVGYTVATARGDTELRAMANRNLATSYKARGDYHRAIDCLAQTMAFAEGARRQERFGQVFLPAVLSRAELAVCHAELGLFAEGTAFGEEGLRIAETVAHPASLMAACSGLGQLALRQGDLPGALTSLEWAMSICRDADFPVYSARIAADLGAAYTRGGRVDEAVPLLTQAVEQATALETLDIQALCRLSLGEAQLQAGRLEEAHTLADWVLAYAHAHQEGGHEAYALRLLGDIAARREPLARDQAEAHYHQALALAEALGMRPLQAHCHLGLGTLYAKASQREDAHTELSTAIDLYRAMGMTFWLPQAETVLAQVEGR
jgi:class 3 adenylate cyclase/tetratricopeptide (TPR) repeat protein